MDCEEVRDKLDAHLLGALENEESKRLEDHLKICALCREYLVEAIQAMESLHALPGIEPKGGYAERILSLKKRKRRYFLTITIGLVLLFFLILWLIWMMLQYRRIYPQYHLNLLVNGIQQYHIKHLEFPREHLAALLLSDAAGGPYISEKIFKGDDGSIVDPWGTPYRYRCPGQYNRSTFDLYSCGPNKRDENGGGDDIKNWESSKD